MNCSLRKETFCTSQIPYVYDLSRYCLEVPILPLVIMQIFMIFLVISGFIFRVTVTGGKGHVREGMVLFPVITVRKASGKLIPTNHQSFTSTPERMFSFC